jgi:hypothetical protein
MFVVQACAIDSNGLLMRRGDVIRLPPHSHHDFKAPPGPDFIYLGIAKNGFTSSASTSNSATRGARRGGAASGLRYLQHNVAMPPWPSSTVPMGSEGEVSTHEGLPLVVPLALAPPMG